MTFKANYLDVKSRITGRVALTMREAIMLQTYAEQSDVYVEIGTLWGGSAILAALAGATHVYCIDPMNVGYWKKGDPSHKQSKLTVRATMENFARFAVAYRISLVMMQSDPWPLPFEVIPDTIFIDGDHSYDGALADWENARAISTNRVMFHDYQRNQAECKRMIDEVVLKDDEWSVVNKVDALIVLERK